jgi:hypothetical protein
MQGFGRKITRQAAAILAVSMTVATAQAATVTDTAPVSGFSPALGADVFVPQFNPTLGTLTGASVSLTGQFTPQVVTPEAGSGGGALNLSSAEFNPQIGLLSVSSPLSVVLPLVLIQPLLVEAVQGSTGATLTGTPEAVDVTGFLPAIGTPLDPIGSGILDFSIEGSSGLTLNGIPLGDAYSDLATLDGQVAVTYTYTLAQGDTSGGAAVPEPASIALLGVSLLSLVLLRYRGRTPTSV